MKDKLQELREMRAKAKLGGGQSRIDDQHARGKLTARERIDALVDSGTFQELGRLATHNFSDFGMAEKRFPGDGVVTGFAKIDGRRVAVYAQDFTILGGSFSEVQSQKVCKIMELAMESGIPVVGLLDSGGARIQEGVRSLAAYGELFVRNVMASGVVPQISVQMGPCAGGAVYSPALTDFIIMVRKTGYMFITGPDVIKAVTGEQVDFDTLGGAVAHNTLSGVAHFAADDEVAAFRLVKEILSYLPQNNSEDPPRVQAYDDPGRRDDMLDRLVPEDSSQPYDMRQIIASVFDRGSFLETHAHYARNALVGLARLDGYPVGVVANQPMFLAGVLDIDSSDKIARWVRFCDAFNLPIITFVDTPGYMPGIAQEHGGIIRHGAKVIYAYCEATVPKVSVVIRKAMGGAYIAMSSKQMRTDLAYAWPTAEIAVMGPEGAINILYREELKRAEDPNGLRKQLLQEYVDRFHNPYAAADMGQIDEVIEPSFTRLRLVNALEILRSKVASNPPKKHGLMPV
ncbi:MAG: acyl-CoA carboxylase subunit beta [Anaerolineae bacterium]|jgi:acetyl-CoA carboxylase carboxyltransferase component|nr:acyl-CoA carboxylase subunit beta [Anaerolineae bacterium]